MTLCNREFIVRMQRSRRQIFQESCNTSCSTAGPLIARTWSTLGNVYSVSGGSYSLLNPLTTRVYPLNTIETYLTSVCDFSYLVQGIPFGQCPSVSVIFSTANHSCFKSFLFSVWGMGWIFSYLFGYSFQSQPWSFLSLSLKV